MLVYTLHWLRAGAAVKFRCLDQNRIKLPEPLKPVEKHLEAWLGPSVALDEIPHFEISHNGDKATYLEFYVGEEERLGPAILPQDLSIYDGVHITALGKTKQQIRFADVCRERGARMISSGSFLNVIKENPNDVRSLITKSDVFLISEEEAVGEFLIPLIRHLLTRKVVVYHTWEERSNCCSR